MEVPPGVTGFRLADFQALLTVPDALKMPADAFDRWYRDPDGTVVAKYFPGGASKIRTNTSTTRSLCVGANGTLLVEVDGRMLKVVPVELFGIFIMHAALHFYVQSGSKRGTVTITDVLTFMAGTLGVWAGGRNLGAIVQEAVRATVDAPPEQRCIQLGVVLQKIQRLDSEFRAFVVGLPPTTRTLLVDLVATLDALIPLSATESAVSRFVASAPCGDPLANVMLLPAAAVDTAAQQLCILSEESFVNNWTPYTRTAGGGVTFLLPCHRHGKPPAAARVAPADGGAGGGAEAAAAAAATVADNVTDDDSAVVADGSSDSAERGGDGGGGPVQQLSNCCTQAVTHIFTVCCTRTAAAAVAAMHVNIIVLLVRFGFYFFHCCFNFLERRLNRQKSRSHVAARCRRVQ